MYLVATEEPAKACVRVQAKKSSCMVPSNTAHTLVDEHPGTHCIADTSGHEKRGPA
jgi:hypothetical protein